MLVWTEAYRPFILGGDVHAPIATEIEDIGEPFDLGGGYFGHLFQNPNTGDLFVAESTSGAFVGPCPQQVKQDIAEGDPGFMATQVADGIERRKKAAILPEEEFWRQLTSPNKR